MTHLNAGLILGLVAGLCGVFMAALAFAISRAPGWRELRSFALVALASAAYCFADIVHIIHVSSTTQWIGESFTLAACFIYALAWIRHLAIADKRPLSRIERAALAIGGVMVILALIPGLLIAEPLRTVPVPWLGVTYTMATPTVLGVVCVVYMLGSVLAAAFGGRRARLPMIGAIALALSGVCDTLSSLELIVMPQITEAVTVVVVGALGLSYARRFIADARRLEELSTKLEQEVAHRTSELVEAQANAARQERLAGLGRIAAGVAHEINNPAMVVQQNLDRIRALVRESAGPASELTARLERSRAATDRIADIARQLLETGRTVTDERARAKVIAIAPIVTRAVSAASVTAPELRAEIVLEPKLCVRGDPGALEQVLINLLVNAQHAAQSTTGGARVTIACRRIGAAVRISVTDNGSGIPAAIRDRLFEPFATTKPVGRGTGLGLAVSRGLMTRQGGALFVASSTAAGTEMAVELPAAEASELSAVPQSGPPSVPALRRDLRVLVIDDDDDVREVLLLQLGLFCHVEAAGTVEEALAMAASQAPYDVVLCDLVMPNGGAEAWLSRCDPRLDERTILLTGGPTTPAASALVEDRREKVLFKPVELGDLRPMIDRVSRA